MKVLSIYNLALSSPILPTYAPRYDILAKVPGTSRKLYEITGDV